MRRRRLICRLFHRRAWQPFAASERLIDEHSFCVRYKYTYKCSVCGHIFTIIGSCVMDHPGCRRNI
jgi:hypothetical protein